MNLSHLNPFIRYANLHLTHWHKKEFSVCYDCRLFYVLQGDGTLYVGAQKYSVFQNSVIYIPSGSHYRFDFTDRQEGQLYVLDFDLTDERSDLTHSIGTATESSFDARRVIPVTLGGKFEETILAEGSVALHEKISACVNLFLERTANYQHFASAYLKLALLDLLNESQLDRKDFRLVQNVQEYIRRYYHRSDLNNQTVAEAFSYHPYHISRLMKQYTQKPLHKYILDYRLHMARIYLTTTEMSITEIASQSGFASYTYFIKIFREKIGTSPLQYRKAHRTVGF